VSSVFSCEASAAVSPAAFLVCPAGKSAKPDGQQEQATRKEAGETPPRHAFALTALYFFGTNFIATEFMQ